MRVSQYIINVDDCCFTGQRAVVYAGLNIEMPGNSVDFHLGKA